MKKRLTYLVLLISAILLSAETGSASAQVIDCPSGFNTTTTANGSCGISGSIAGADFWTNYSPTLSGTALVLAPSDAGHASHNLNKVAKVNVQAFTTTFTFTVNAENIAFILQNDTHGAGDQYSYFQAGAGAEGGFSQFANGDTWITNDIFAMQFNLDTPATNVYGAFTHSTVQIYQGIQEPNLPMQSLTGYSAMYPTNKLSTAPVSLNSPIATASSPSKDTFSATITYDGANVTLKLFDVTAGGTCSSSSSTTCFTHTWTNVLIPSIVGADTAYVGISAGTQGLGEVNDLLVKSFVYTVNSPTATPAFTAWNANSTYVSGGGTDAAISSASPVYSIQPGTYSGAQSVSISTSTTPHNYICYTLSAAKPSLYPQPDNDGGCTSGTLYTEPVSISSTATLYAVAGSNNSAFALGSTKPTGLGPPSTLVAGTYTIGTGTSTAATPTFSPAGGTFTAAQSVALSGTSSGSVICYSTTGIPKTDGATGCTSGTMYTAPISVASSETISAIAGGTGFTDSPVATSSYVIQPPAPKPVATTTTLSAPTNSLVNGQQTSMTATVTPASGAAATGNVSFFAGAQLLGSATLNNGQATFTGTPATQPGTYQVTATYSGSSLDNKSTAVPLTFTVVTTTTTGLTSSANQVVEGSPVVLTAAVAPLFGTGTPTGPVAFYVGATALGTQPLSGGKATDSAQINLPAGQYQVTAVYAGDGIDELSTSNALTLTVMAPVVPQVSTNTFLTVTPILPAAGQSMQLSALVTAASGSKPTGVVNFYLGQTQLGSASLTAGVSSVSVTAPATSGSYQLTAVYAGTAKDSSSSSAPVTITIAPTIESTSIILVASAQQLIQGQSLALSATVTAKGATPTKGTVNFFLGQTQLGSVAIVNGQASWTGSASVAPGLYLVTATYTGSTLDSSSTSPTVPLIIIADPATQTFKTLTALTLSSQQVTTGQSMSLAVQVAEQGGTSTPAGSVALYLGNTHIGTAILENGTASLTFAAPSAGTYQVKAIYSGEGQDLSSQSSSLPLTVLSDPTAPTFATLTALTLSSQQATTGQNISLSVQVAEQGGTSTPGGAISLYLGQTQIGTAILTNGSASLSMLAPAPGTYQVTAVYAGSAPDNASTSPAVSLTVNPIAATPTFNTVTALTVGPDQITAGQTMSLSVQVAEQGGASTPTGSVTLYLGETPIGTTLLSNGATSLSMIAPAAGTYTLAATYAGSGQDLGSQSSAVTLVVNAATSSVPVTPPPATNPSFTVGLSNNTIDLAQGHSASLQVLLSAVQGYQGAVQLSCSGLPAGVACNFSPATVSLQSTSANSMLSISSSTVTASNTLLATAVSYGMLAPWNLIGLLGIMSGRRRRRFNVGSIFVLLLAAGAGLFAITGCGVSVQSVATPYQVSVTAVGANQQSQTQSFTLTVTAPAASI